MKSEIVKIIESCGWKVVSHKEIDKTIYMNKIGESDGNWQLHRLLGKIPEDQVAIVEKRVLRFTIEPIHRIYGDDPAAINMAYNPIFVEDKLRESGYNALAIVMSDCIVIDIDF